MRQPLVCSFMLAVAVTMANAAPLDTAAILETLHKEPAPKFARGHTLPRLTIWVGTQLPYEVRVELAERWGYALWFGRTTPKVIESLNDPESMYSKMLNLTAKEPQRYPLQVIVAPAFTIREYIEELPLDAFATDAEGKLVDDKRVWSPLAPDSVFERIADEELKMLNAVRQRAPIAYVLNGGEYALSPAGHTQKYFEHDPKIMKAKGQRSWYEFLSEHKGRQERIVADKLRAAVPDRVLYIYYYADGSPHRNRYAGWEQWDFSYEHMQYVTDLPSSSLYYGHYNTGFTGNYDLLTMALNSAAQQIKYGHPLSYNWVCAGWKRDSGFWSKEDIGDIPRYIGFLKCWYAAGMIGGISGYFAYDAPQNWINQLAAHGQVSALFSHLEEYLRKGDLLAGPNPHRWSKDLPAYELPTGDPGTRVVARKHRDKDEWLVVAWAADGNDREVSVEIPPPVKALLALWGAAREPGIKVTLNARAAGSVYVLQLREGKPELKLVDEDPLHPTAHL